MLHAHVHSASRDCDGRYTSDHDVPADPGEDGYDFAERMFGSLYHQPSPQEPVDILLLKDDHGKIVMRMARRTEEGHQATEVTICDRDDYDPEPSHRDHTAEAAGY